MTTYSEYQKQIAELTEQAEQVRKAELNEARTKIKELMLAHGLSALDFGTTAKVRKERIPVAVKFKNPATGETWTGRGRTPRWLNGQNKDDFLV